MSQINLDLPRDTIVAQVAIAGLAAVGLTSLIPPSGGRAQATLVVPLLAALLAVVLVLRTRETVVRAREEAGSAATMDPLTGVATARAGEATLGREFAAAQRGRTLTVVLIRVEGLSRYRSEHGGAVADRLLREVGLTLARHQRGMHLTARHAGQPGTFVSILSGTERKGAAVYATRVRRELLQLRGLPRLPGVSVGIAAFDMSMKSPRSLIRQAEFALKKGAAQGGKVVVVGGAAA